LAGVVVGLVEIDLHLCNLADRNLIVVVDDGDVSGFILGAEVVVEDSFEFRKPT
jgi:hypothetical protein